MAVSLRAIASHGSFAHVVLVFVVAVAPGAATRSRRVCRSQAQSAISL